MQNLSHHENLHNEGRNEPASFAILQGGRWAPRKEPSQARELIQALTDRDPERLSQLLCEPSESPGIVPPAFRRGVSRLMKSISERNPGEKEIGRALLALLALLRAHRVSLPAGITRSLQRAIRVPGALNT